MIIVIDSNIAFASLIKGESSGILRIIMLEEDITFVIPEEGLDELHEHSSELKDKSNSYKNALMLLFTRIHVIPRDFYEEKLRDAYTISREFDEGDTPFIALAMKLNSPIWTNDKNMIVYGINTGKYIAMDSKAIVELINGKSLREIMEFLKSRYVK